MPVIGWLHRSWLRWLAQIHLVLGRPGHALARFDALLREAPHDRHAMASRAHLLADSGQKAQAIVALQVMTHCHPLQASGWFNLAYLLDEEGRFELAESAFAQALVVDPALDRAWYGLGLLLLRQGRLDEAATALGRNTALQPMSPFGWYQLARVEMERRRTDEAHRILAHLRGFEPKVAAQLARELDVLTAQQGRPA